MWFRLQTLSIVLRSLSIFLLGFKSFELLYKSVLHKKENKFHWPKSIWNWTENLSLELEKFQIGRVTQRKATLLRNSARIELMNNQTSYTKIISLPLQLLEFKKLQKTSVVIRIYIWKIIGYRKIIFRIPPNQFIECYLKENLNH